MHQGLCLHLIPSALHCNSTEQHFSRTTPGTLTPPLIQPAESSGTSSKALAEEWGVVQEQAFAEPKQCLTTAPVLAFADY